MSANYSRIFKVLGVDSIADEESVKQCVHRMRMDGVWAGEEVILVAADLLQRDLHVYKYVEKAGTFPVVYAAALDCRAGPPLGLAFYEPGHYHAVFDDVILEDKAGARLYSSRVPGHLNA
jgi:hypothetical protein